MHATGQEKSRESSNARKAERWDPGYTDVGHARTEGQIMHTIHFGIISQERH